MGTTILFVIEVSRCVSHALAPTVTNWWLTSFSARWAVFSLSPPLSRPPDAPRAAQSGRPLVAGPAVVATPLNTTAIYGSGKTFWLQAGVMWPHANALQRRGVSWPRHVCVSAVWMPRAAALIHHRPLSSFSLERTPPRPAGLVVANVRAAVPMRGGGRGGSILPLRNTRLIVSLAKPI